MSIQRMSAINSPEMFRVFFVAVVSLGNTVTSEMNKKKTEHPTLGDGSRKCDSWHENKSLTFSIPEGFVHGLGILPAFVAQLPTTTKFFSIFCFTFPFPSVRNPPSPRGLEGMRGARPEATAQETSQSPYQFNAHLTSIISHWQRALVTCRGTASSRRRGRRGRANGAA